MPNSAATSKVERERGKSVLDVLMIAVTVGFFALSLAYVAGCERL
jgi:hypothetical protein